MRFRKAEDTTGTLDKYYDSYTPKGLPQRRIYLNILAKMFLKSFGILNLALLNPLTLDGLRNRVNENVGV